MNWTSWVIPRSIRQHGVSLLLLLLCHTLPPFKTRPPKEKGSKKHQEVHQTPLPKWHVANRLLNRSVMNLETMLHYVIHLKFFTVARVDSLHHSQSPHPTNIFVILRQWHSCKKVIDLRIQLCFPFGLLIENRPTWLNLDELHSLKLTNLTYQEAIPKGNEPSELPTINFQVLC